MHIAPFQFTSVWLEEDEWDEAFTSCAAYTGVAGFAAESNGEGFGDGPKIQIVHALSEPNFILKHADVFETTSAGVVKFPSPSLPFGVFPCNAAAVAEAHEVLSDCPYIDACTTRALALNRATITS